MRVCFTASQPHYVDHLHGIWGRLQVLGIDVHVHDLSLDGPLDDDGTPTVIAGHGDLKMIPGSRPIALLSHGVDQTYVGVDHGAYAGGRDRERIGLFLCPSARSAAINAARYPTARHRLCGPTRLDPWFLGDLTRAHRAGERRPVIGLAWHHDSTICPETRNAWPHYAPVIDRLVEQDRFSFVGHGHPRDRETWQAQYGSRGIEYVPNVDQFLGLIDLLAADNTSLLYEAAALGIPTLTLDAPWYRPDVNHGLRFWDAIPGWRLTARRDAPQTGGACIGAFWGRDHLGDAIDVALAPGGTHNLERPRVLAEAYGDGAGGTLLDGKAADRAAVAIVEWIS